MGILPTKSSIPAQYLHEYNIVVFGEAGVGKTSFAVQPENSVLIQFEDGAKGLSCYKVNLIEKAKEKYGDEYKQHVWTMFQKTIQELLKGDHSFEYVASDSIDRAYDFRMEHYKGKKGYHPGGKKDDFGQSWNEFNSGFKDEFYKLMESSLGLINISHATTKAIEDVRGDKYDKIVPAAGGKMGQWLIDEADIVLFYDRDIEGNRVLRVESDGNYEAKQRLPFQNEVIPAGNSSQETFNNFKKEFELAIINRNKELGITEEMIEEHYAAKKEKKLLKNILKEIKKAIKTSDIKTEQAAEIIQEKYGVNKLSELNLQQAKKYLEYMKKQ